MNWGPTQMSDQFFNYADLRLSTPLRSTFQARTTNDPQYRLFRFFNYGQTDLSFNLTCLDGSVYALANSISFKNSADMNPFLRVPLSNLTSKTKPIILTKGKSF